MESIAQKIIYEIFFGDHKISADLQVPDTVLMDAPYHAGLAFERFVASSTVRTSG